MQTFNNGVKIEKLSFLVQGSDPIDTIYDFKPKYLTDVHNVSFSVFDSNIDRYSDPNLSLKFGTAYHASLSKGIFCKRISTGITFFVCVTYTGR